MKKKDYQQPEMRVVKIQHQYQLLANSVTDVDSGDTGIGFGGGGSSGGRAPGFVGFDDWGE